MDCIAKNELQTWAEGRDKVLEGRVHLFHAGQGQEARQETLQRMHEQPGAVLVGLLVLQQLEGQSRGPQGPVAQAVPGGLLLVS